VFSRPYERPRRNWPDRWLERLSSIFGIVIAVFVGAATILNYLTNPRPIPNPGELPRRSWLDRWLERLSWIFGIVAAIFVVIAAVIALMELGHVKSLISEIGQGNRVSATLNYDARYKSDPLVSYATRLKTAWFSDEGRNKWQKSREERANFVIERNLGDATALSGYRGLLCSGPPLPGIL
jgi:hypothetical protein